MWTKVFLETILDVATHEAKALQWDAVAVHDPNQLASIFMAKSKAASRSDWIRITRAQLTGKEEALRIERVTKKGAARKFLEPEGEKKIEALLEAVRMSVRNAHKAFQLWNSEKEKQANLPGLSSRLGISKEGSELPDPSQLTSEYLARCIAEVQKRFAATQPVKGLATRSLSKFKALCPKCATEVSADPNVLRRHPFKMGSFLIQCPTCVVEVEINPWQAPS
jgi:hypothetical protein